MNETVAMAGDGRVMMLNQKPSFLMQRQIAPKSRSY